MNHFLYILRFSDNSLYIGQTNNLEKRLEEHKSKNSKASKFSKEHENFKLVYQEKFNTRLESIRSKRMAVV